MQNLFNLSLQQVMEETAKSILARVPKPFDIGQVMEKHPVVYEESMNTVLQQEVKLPDCQNYLSTETENKSQDLINYFFHTASSNTSQIILYNNLLKMIHSSLQDLLKALKGLVVMSEALETMSVSVFNNIVPDMWANKAYPSLKPLGSWVADLLMVST